MLKSRIAVIGAVFVASAFAMPAYAFELDAFGHYNIAGDSITPTQTGMATAASIGYGLGGRFGLGAVDLQIGVSMLNRGFTQTGLITPGVTSSLYIPSTTIPVTVEYSFIPGLAAGVGAYYGFLSSSVTTVTNGTPTPGTAASMSSGDYGLIAAADYRMSLAPSLKFIVGAQYHLGLANLTTVANNTMNTNDLLFNVGLGISL